MTAELAIYESGLTFPRGAYTSSIDAPARDLNLRARSKEPRSGKVLGGTTWQVVPARSHGGASLCTRGQFAARSGGELSL